jgi:hypothetical protein
MHFVVGMLSLAPMAAAWFVVGWTTRGSSERKREWKRLKERRRVIPGDRRLTIIYDGESTRISSDLVGGRELLDAIAAVNHELFHAAVTVGEGVGMNLDEIGRAMTAPIGSGEGR